MTEGMVAVCISLVALFICCSISFAEYRSYRKRTAEYQIRFEHVRSLEELEILMKLIQHELEMLDRWLGWDGKKRTECIPPRKPTMHCPEDFLMPRDEVSVFNMRPEDIL